MPEHFFSVADRNWIGELMELKIIWFVPPPLALIAETQGFNAARGLDVEHVVTRGSDQQYEALVDGTADAAITAMDNVLMWNRRGAFSDVRIVAQTETETGLILVARQGLYSLAALKGSELLVDCAENGFAVALCAMLHDAGMRPEDYRMTVVGGVRERFNALMEGRGDATLLATFLEDAALAKDCTTLARVDDVYPDFPGQGLATRTGALKRTGPALAAWLSAMQEARVWARHNADAARSIVSEAGFPPTVAKILISTIPLSFRPNPAGIALLLSQRRQMGLPGAKGTNEILVDTTLLTSGLA